MTRDPMQTPQVPQVPQVLQPSQPSSTTTALDPLIGLARLAALVLTIVTLICVVIASVIQSMPLRLWITLLMIVAQVGAIALWWWSDQDTGTGEEPPQVDTQPNS